MWKWEEGRQGGGYMKLTLLATKWFDCHILHMPEGSRIAGHTDPAPEGKQHHRLNITLKDADIGGYFWRHDPEGVAYYCQTLFRRFRPDIERHGVSEIILGDRWTLSIGWIANDVVDSTE